MAIPTVNLTGPPLSGGTLQVGGSRFGQPPSSAFNPQGFGPNQINAPATSLTGPPFFSGAGINGQSTSQAASEAAASPFSLQKSPLLWAVIGLVGALVATHHLAFKD